MRRRKWLIVFVVLVSIFGLVAFFPPTVLFGRRHLRRTLAFGPTNPTLCYTAYGDEAAISRSIWMLPMFPSIKEVALSRRAPFTGAPPLADRLAKLASNPWLVSLDLYRVDVTDADVISIASMSQLEWLNLSGNPKITDTGIAHLARCTRLRYLDLDGTRVTPAGIAALSDCINLEYLSMRECVVTDENVEQIPRFPRLRHVFFNGAGLTEKGIEHFLTWHFLTTFGAHSTIPQESRIELNKRFRAEWERAKAAGEDVPTERHRGRLFFVPDARK